MNCDGGDDDAEPVGGSSSGAVGGSNNAGRSGAGAGQGGTSQGGKSSAGSAGTSAGAGGDVVGPGMGGAPSAGTHGGNDGTPGGAGGVGGPVADGGAAGDGGVAGDSGTSAGGGAAGDGGTSAGGGAAGDGGSGGDAPSAVGCTTVPFEFLEATLEAVPGTMGYVGYPIDGDRGLAVHVVLSQPATLTLDVRVPYDSSFSCCNAGTCTAPNWPRLYVNIGGYVSAQGVTDPYWLEHSVEVPAGEQYVTFGGEGSGGLCNDWPEELFGGTLHTNDPFYVTNFCFTYH
jgi:hypothetical protein